MYRCRICSKEFSEIPKDAVPVSQMRRGYQLLRFKNGELHDIKEMKQKPSPEPVVAPVTKPLEVLVAVPVAVPAEPFETVDVMVSKLQKRWRNEINQVPAQAVEEKKL